MQEIIIYRNPAEAAFWNSMMNGGAGIFFAVIALGIFWAVVCTFAEKLLSKRYGWGAGKKAMWVANISTLSLALFLHFQNIG